MLIVEINILKTIGLNKKLCPMMKNLDILKYKSCLKYLMFTLSGFKDIGIRKCGYVANILFFAI